MGTYEDGWDPDDGIGWEDYNRRHPDGHPWAPPPEPEATGTAERRYVCMRCQVELSLTYIKRVERIEPMNYTTGKATVRMVHQCPCVNLVRATVYPWDDGALSRLFGGQRYTLPWPMTHQEERGEVATTATSPVGRTYLEEREKAVERWAWDLEGVTTAQDFLSQCRGPRSQDAEIVTEFLSKENPSQ